MMASPVSYLCPGVVVIKEACKAVYKCMPPFPVLKEFAQDIVKLTNDVNFRLRALPFKVAKALRRIIHMPLDIIRFCTSVKLASVLRRASVRARPISVLHASALL